MNPRRLCTAGTQIFISTQLEKSLTISTIEWIDRVAARLHFKRTRCLCRFPIKDCVERRVFVPTLAVFLALAAGMAQAQRSPKLAQLAAEFWEHKLSEDLDLEMKSGLRVSRLPDVSWAGSHADAGFAQALLSRLDQISLNELDDVDYATYQTLKFELRNTVDAAPFFWLRFQVTPYTSPIPVANRVFTSYRFNGPEDRASYFALLSQYPAFIRAIQMNMRGQAARNIRLPKPEIELVRTFLLSYIGDLKQSPFYVNSERLQAAGTPAEVSDFQGRVAALVTQRINPALQALVQSMSGDYRSRAPDKVGLSQYPNGKKYYEYLVRLHTTLDVTPEEVHRIGLEQVAELETKMEQVRARLGYGGKEGEFTRFILTDPRFYPKTPDEMKEKMSGFIAQIEPKLNTMFLELPKAPYGIERLPASLEKAQTFGIYHQPSATEPRGIYYFNGSDLQHRTLINAGALIYHELMPGHHLQMNLQRENTDLPDFRHHGYYTAYSEGWGCYATTLAEDMGMYEDPSDYYGYLAMNMFYTVRLVVDTGMNYLGWSRQRASRYMRAHLIESDQQIATETLRYSVDYPGQSLAYRMGEMEFEKLRQQAKKDLGERYDVRQFHEWVLAPGAVPLPVLEREFERRLQKSLAN